MTGIEDKLKLLNKQIFTKQYLDEFLKKIPQEYSIYDLTKNGGVLKVIKRNAYYLNVLYPKLANPFVVGATYCDYQEYMFGGLALYNRYGFTNQIANKYLLYSTTFYGTKKILDTRYDFKKVKKEVIYGYKEKMIDGVYVRIMKPERAFIEFCRENMSRITTLREIYTNKIDKQLLQEVLRKYPYQNIRAFIQKEIMIGK